MAEKKSKLPDDPSLEQVVDRLESIVEELEGGEADLEKSIALFREGKLLGNKALKRLETLDRKVELVIRAEGDALVTEEFESE